MQAISPEFDFVTKKEHSKSSSGSYDENDYENYVEDRDYCYNGSEQNPVFTKHHVFGKAGRKEKSLKEDLKKAGFSLMIISKADEVFSQMNSGLKRGVRRKQLMFFCVQTAYNLLKIPEDPASLATMCGISPSEMLKANSMCSPSKISYQAPPVRWLPKDFLRVYYQKIVEMDIISESEEMMEDIEKICNDVMSKHNELRDEKPQSVAAAVIVFYLGLHGCAIEKKKYTEIFARSDMTIQKVKNKVAVAYNS